MRPLQDINKDSVNKEDQSAYWYQRYSLRPLLDAQGNVTLAPSGAAVHDVPLFLEEAKDSILMTGKYLNAIRECGRPVERPLPSDVHIGGPPRPEREAERLLPAWPSDLSGRLVCTSICPVSFPPPPPEPQQRWVPGAGPSTVQAC